MITARIQRLLDRVKSASERVIHRESEQRFYAETIGAVMVEKKLPPVLQYAEFLYKFAEKFPIEPDNDELIAGSQRFTRPELRKYLTEDELTQIGPFGNIGHICVDYGRFLCRGVQGLRSDISAMPPGNNKEAFYRALEAFSLFVRRHGCDSIAEAPPMTFHDALQLVWFIHVFLHAENNAAAVSFGRLDQYLGLYLENDLDSGVITREEAYELICCFCIKCCEGDESQNLTLGGTENRLSIMLLRVMAELKIWQPSLSVRIGPDTSGEFMSAAVDLCAVGTGMPSFFNEPVVTGSLEKLGIPRNRAEDWGIVGCYEAAPMGNSYPLTVAGGIVLPEILWDFLQNDDDWNSFDEFYVGFKSFFRAKYIQSILPEFEKRRIGMADKFPSPFESICVTGCIESGLNAEEGGAIYNLYGVNILGIGSLIDSLLSIRKLIFDDKDITFEQMTTQLADNFPDKKLLLRCRNLPDKFGSDCPATNKLAANISSFIAKVILNHPMSCKTRPYPGFFWFGQDIHRHVAAGPDGRIAGERVSYGCGPGEMLDNAGVTSILNSAACIAHSLCACGNPLTISLNRSDVAGDSGKARIRQLVESYFQRGGFHLHFNIVDAEQLEDAKLNPEKYADLVVRVSGYSATFINIAESWQDAIIERTKLGM